MADQPRRTAWSRLGAIALALAVMGVLAPGSASLLGSSAASAANRQVLQVDPTGRGGAFQTVTQAIAAASATGARIELQAGQYWEDLVLTTPGTAGAPFTIRPAAGVATSDVVLHGSISVEAAHVSISGFTIDGTQPNGSIRRMSAIRTQAPSTSITNMRLLNLGGWGIESAVLGDQRQQAAGGYIARNYLYNISAGIQVVGSTVVEFNEIERINMHGSTDPLGDVFRVFGPNVVFRGNYAHGTVREEVAPVHADGIQSWDDIGAPVSNVLVEGNIFSGWMNQGIMLENDAFGPTGVHLISDWTVRNNIFEGFDAWGVCAGKAQGGIPNMIIDHNVFAGAPGGAHYGPILNGTGGSGRIVNNIIMNISAQARGAREGAVVDSGHNLIYNSRVLDDLGPGELQGIAPGLVNPAGGDYRLLPGSPAIDAGVATQTGTDINGVPRTRGVAPDIGPYEWDTPSQGAGLPGGPVAPAGPAVDGSVEQDPVPSPSPTAPTPIATASAPAPTSTALAGIASTATRSGEAAPTVTGVGSTGVALVLVLAVALLAGALVRYWHTYRARRPGS